MKNNYLYLLSITGWVRSNDNLYSFIKSMDAFYESLEDAIENGILYIERNIFYELADSEDDIARIAKLFETDERYGYNFEITKICCNHIKFKSYNEEYEYYKNNIKNISKEDIYEFLMKIAKIEHLRYSYSGRLIDAQLGNLEINTCSSRAFDEKNYHCTKFKIGDKVKRKEFGDDIYIIDWIDNKDNSIYDSTDPLRFVKGYILKPINDSESINDYEAFRFMDEDLELIGG